MKIGALLLLFILVLILTAGGIVWYFLGPIQSKGEQIIFTVAEGEDNFDVAFELKKENLIRETGVFLVILSLKAGDKKILAGGYKLKGDMNAFQIIDTITSKPDLVWVTIREGLRKEQVGEALATVLGWDSKRQKEWLEKETTIKSEYFEGVYFPDTYLIPVDESNEQVTQRLISHFHEKMADLFPQFAQKDILWTTGLKIASLIQREAGGVTDMPLISGIIWNRLDKGMKLEIDATLQYIKGNQEDGWWGKVEPADKLVDSPFNTYQNKGLPPQPICNPGLAAIEAVLNPAQTDCFYYLHDHNRQIHCAKTYEEHLQNIKEFL
jgi:UPF0755 protein